VRRIVVLVVLSCALAGCGFGGPSAANYAVKSCTTVDAPSDPAASTDSGTQGGMSVAAAMLNTAANQAAQAAAKDQTWKQLGRTLSDLASEFRSIAAVTDLAPKYWDADQQAQLSRYTTSWADQLATINAECRRARAS